MYLKIFFILYGILFILFLKRLKNILNSDWYDNEENTNIILYTENEKCIYKVFSIYKIESEDYYIKKEFSDDNNFEQFVNTIKKRSIK